MTAKIRTLKLASLLILLHLQLFIIIFPFTSKADDFTDWGATWIYNKSTATYENARTEYSNPNEGYFPTDGGEVLWDLTHGVFLEYEPDGKYSNFVALLNNLSFTVDTTTASLNTVDLTGYEIIVICIGSSWTSAYSQLEITALKNAIAEGKGLLILSDNTYCPNDNINTLTQTFGVTCGVGTVYDPLDLYFNDFTRFPVFDDINDIYYRAAGVIETDSTASIIGAYDSLRMVAVTGYDRGRVITLSDMNCFENAYLDSADNRLFAENVFNWLADINLSVEDNIHPIVNHLSFSYPNPFNSQTTIAYSIHSKSLVELEVFNLKGQMIASLFKGIQNPGDYNLRWNSEGNPSGVYFYKISTDQWIDTGKMSLLK